AAPHLEEVERVVQKLFRRHPRSKRAVVSILSRNSPQSGRDRSARKFIFQMQFDQRGEAQTQAIGIGLRKDDAQHLIKDESRFEVRPSQRVFDPAGAMAQVESLGALFRRRKQPLQPPPKISSLADVRLGVQIFPAQKKHRRSGSGGGKDFGVSLRPELYAFGQHALDCSACDCTAWDCSAKLSETGALELLAVVVAFHPHYAAHLMEAGTHAVADAVA